MNSETTQLYEFFQPVFDRQDQAFKNLLEWHRDCKRLYKLYHSWENRRTYTYHNNVDVPLAFKLVESILPYSCGNTLEPGCVALDEADKETAERMNQQIKYFNASPSAKKAYSAAAKWKLITGVGFIKDGWNLSQPLLRRWVNDDEELLDIASKSDIKELRDIALEWLSPEMLESMNQEYEQKSQEIQAMSQQEVLMGLEPEEPTPPPTPEEAEQYNAAVLEKIKEFCRRTTESGEPVCPTIVPQGTWFYTFDVDEYAAPALMAVPTWDIAWLGIGDDIQQYEAIYHRYYISKHQLARIQKSAEGNAQSGWVNLQYVIDHASEENTTSERTQQAWDPEIPRASTVEFIEETRRDEDGNIMITTICPGASCVVRRMKSPFFHNQINFTRVVTFPGVADLRGVSLLKVVESLCMAVLKQANSLLDNSDLIQNPAFLARGAHLTDKQMSLYAGRIIEFQGEMRPLEIPDARMATQQIINYLLSLIYSVTGCVEMLDGVIPMLGNGEGRADLSDLRYSSTARLRYQLNEDSIAYSRLMERICSNIMQFNRDPRKVPVMVDGKTVYIDYKPATNVGSFRFFTDASSMVSVDPAVLRAQLTGLLNIADKITVAHHDEESGQYVKRLLPSKRYLYRAYAQTFGIGNPENFMASPDSDEAIPSDQLPVMPQPEQQPESEGQAAPGATAPGQMPPQGGGESVPPEAINDAMNMSPDQLAAALQQATPEAVDQLLGALPPEKAQAVAQLMQGTMPMDTGNGITPDQAVAINTGDFSGGAMNNASVAGVGGLPPQLGGTQQMGSGNILPPQQMAYGTDMMNIRKSAENLQ